MACTQCKEPLKAGQKPAVYPGLLLPFISTNDPKLKGYMYDKCSWTYGKVKKKKGKEIILKKASLCSEELINLYQKVITVGTLFSQSSHE